MTQAFSGLRIIDFTQVLAGPMATQQLALLGADVIKIEQPGSGDQTRDLFNDRGAEMSPVFMSCNLGKRSLTLNLKAPEAQDIVQRLVRDADAVVENFRPGVMERLGFGYAAFKKIQPNLVYCSVSGYGQTGPKAGVAAFDGAIQADSGMMSINGHPQTGPTRTAYLPVDMATALNAAFALAAALYRRATTGAGQFVDVAMMDTAMILQAAQVVGHLVNDTTLDLIGNRSPSGQPTANVFPAADGHLNVVAIGETQVQALFETLGLGDQLTSAKFATRASRAANYDAVVDLIATRMRQHSKDHWLAALTGAGVPVSAIRSIPEAVADPQFADRAAFVTTTSPTGPVQLVQAGYVTDQDGPLTPRPAPRLGEHTDEVLADLGFSPTSITQLREKQVV